MLIGNVGDSRAYLVRDGACVQITQDHSLLDEQVRSGMITPEMAASSSLQSVITRAIGAADTVEPDFFAAELQLHDMLLLARMASPAMFSQRRLRRSLLPRRSCPRSVKPWLSPKQRGGADNITCIVLRAVETPSAVE